MSENKENLEDKHEKLLELSKNIIEYKHKFNHLQNQLVKLRKLDQGLESKEFISNKLGELILVIANKKNDRASYQEDYDLYVQANGALEVLGS